MSSCVQGINTYIKKLEAIADACGEKTVTKETGVKDAFQDLKSRMHELITQIRKGVHDRQALTSKRGICHETIQKGSENRRKLDDLQKLYADLQAVHKKALGKRSSAQKKEELQERWQDVRVLKKLVDDTRELVEAANEGNEDPALRVPSATLLGLREAAARGDYVTNRALSEEENQVMDEISARQKGIDNQLGDLDKVVNRLGDMAPRIGHTAEMQTKQAEEISKGIDKNIEELGAQTKKAKEIIQYQKNTNLCCQMVLGLLLLCIVGFICHQLGLGP
jgi:DNA repair exonuclease SbcCD ATPase subunit